MHMRQHQLNYKLRTMMQSVKMCINMCITELKQNRDKQATCHQHNYTEKKENGKQTDENISKQ